MNQIAKTSEVMNPSKLLEIAVSKDADIDKLSKLMELQVKWEANEARKAYVIAMNEFKADPPEIFKDSFVSFSTSKGKTEYSHASLANVVSVIGAALAKHDLSHHWNIEQLDAGQIRVTCVVTHAMGHSESVPMQSGPDQSGGKNNIQAVASTTTYLQRYTLLSATGLATKENNDDGGGNSEPLERITPEQLDEIEVLIKSVKADKDKFLNYLKIDNLENLTAHSFDMACNMLNAKKKADKKK